VVGFLFGEEAVGTAARSARCAAYRRQEVKKEALSSRGILRYAEQYFSLPLMLATFAHSSPRSNTQLPPPAKNALLSIDKGAFF